MLGGTYYPTQVIPSWIGEISAFVPLTYGLRSLRKLFLAGQPISAVAGDLAILVGFTAILLAASWWAFAAALRHAKRTGSLNQY
jgi:ABC-type multidrug transport system permease subunit